VAIDTIASSLDPELVLIGGGLGRAGWEVLQRLPRQPSWGEVCDVAPAALGDDAGIIGCALAGLEHADRAGARTEAELPACQIP
jgi:glucokinase